MIKGTKIQHWSTAELKKLRLLRGEEGWSFGRIAQHLNRTRNSVISRYFSLEKDRVYDWNMIKSLLGRQSPREGQG